MTDDEKLMQQALEALVGWCDQPDDAQTYDACMQRAETAISALRARLAQLEFDRAHEALEKQAGIHVSQQASAEPVDLQDIEQYRMQMAGICTAALGYWKEGDSVHPDYDTPALREVAELYAKYAKLAAQPKRTPRQWVGLTDSEFDRIWCTHHDDNCQTTGGCWDYERAIEQALKEKNT